MLHCPLFWKRSLFELFPVFILFSLAKQHLKGVGWDGLTQSIYCLVDRRSSFYRLPPRSLYRLERPAPGNETFITLSYLGVTPWLSRCAVGFAFWDWKCVVCLVLTIYSRLTGRRLRTKQCLHKVCYARMLRLQVIPLSVAFLERLLSSISYCVLLLFRSIEMPMALQ